MTKREMLHDIEPNPHPARACENRDQRIAIMAKAANVPDSAFRLVADLVGERDRALARIERLTLYADELEGRIHDEDTTFPVVTREAHIADARKQAGLQPGDLVAAAGGEGGTDGQ